MVTFIAEGHVPVYECRLREASILCVSDVVGSFVHCADVLATVGYKLLADVPHEQIWLVFLSGKNEVRGVLRVSEGGAHGAACTPADVLRPVLLSGCTAFAMIHNHPSGDPTPSAADCHFTRTTIEAAQTVGLHFIDHVIVTMKPGVWCSMRDRDLMSD